MKKKIVILFLAATLAVSGLFAGCGKNEKGGNSSTSEISADSEKHSLYTPVDRKQSDFMPIDWMADYENLVTDCDYKSLDTSDPRYQEDYSDDTGVAGIIQMLEEKTTYADSLSETVEKEFNDTLSAEQTAAESQDKDFGTYTQDTYGLSEEDYKTQRRSSIETDIKQTALAIWLVENMDITVKADSVKDYAELMIEYNTADDASADDSSAAAEETTPKESVEEYLGGLKDDGTLDYFYYLCASEEALSQIRALYN